MRQDFLTYSPQFKLVIAGNHKPRFGNIDEAIRRRVQLIPFTVTIPKEQRDKDLADKLRDEHGAILAWAVEGCREWQRVGLAPSHAVLASTEDYFAEQDRLGDWIEDGWERDPQAWASSKSA
jgi:putative DNA primase/helicase